MRHVVRYVRIPLPIDTSIGVYSLRLGSYSADSLVRYPLRLPIGLLDDQVVLSSIIVC